MGTLTIYVIRFRQDKKQNEVTKRKKFMMKKIRNNHTSRGDNFV